jgi:malate dehydrogenase (quinone)
MPDSEYQVAIVGGGITGAALAYVLARYSDIASVILLEKADRPATVNSAVSQNSQTLHCGDIETNYTVEKAAEVKQAAEMVVRCVEAAGEGGILHRMPKMVLGVGEAECAFLRERFRQFQPLFPDMRLLDAKGVAEAEPEVCRSRRGAVTALARTGAYSAADFGRLTGLLLRKATELSGGFSVRLKCRVNDIVRSSGGYRLATTGGRVRARFVAVCAGAHSLGFAQSQGYGQQYSVLPVAGSFFHARRRVRGKVYTVQSEKLPFAAIHADPDIEHPELMRLGPTALVVPFLERREWSSVPDFLHVVRLNWDAAATFLDILGVAEIQRYAARNLLYEMPVVGVRAFAHEARKILPALRASELRYAHGKGGLRPQLIDLPARKLLLGSARIGSDEGLLFNVTPSPGATSCLANAGEDARRIAGYLGRSFHEEKFRQELSIPA